MITAEEARLMARPDPELVKSHLGVIEAAIKLAAPSRNETIIKTEPYCRWLYDSNRNPTASAVIDELILLGFTCSLYYKENGPFVDMGLRIQW